MVAEPNALGQEVVENGIEVRLLRAVLNRPQRYAAVWREGRLVEVHDADTGRLWFRGPGDWAWVE